MSSASRVAAAKPGSQSVQTGTSETATVRKSEPRSAIAQHASHGASLAAQVVRGTGQPLDSNTRSDMETRFGHDFSRVRVHAGADAVAATHALSARAATLGEHILLSRPPDGSQHSRRLLAHELAHTLQPVSAGILTEPGDAAERAAHRAADLAMTGAPGVVRAARAGGAAPAVRRDVDDDKKKSEEERQLGEIDLFFAGIYRTFYTNVETQSPDVLIAYADTLSQRYVEAQQQKRPQSSRAIATVLTRIHDTLEADEGTAPRDADGALLTQGFNSMEPWSRQRPHSVSELPVFSAENVIAWQADAALDAAQQAAERPRRQAAARAPTPPPMFFAADTITAEPPHDPNAGLTTGVPEEQKQTADEKDASGASPAGGPAVRDGLAALGKKTLKDVLTQTGQKERAETMAGADKPLLDRCGQIWFVSNRLYLLDRSGHLQPRDESWFDISSLRGFKAGEVYFLNPMSNVRGIAFQAFTVKGSVKEETGAINFRSVLRGLIPAMDLRDEAEKNQAGIGLIVAPTFALKQLSISDLSLTRLEVAIRWVPKHLKWAINAEINRIKENPLGEVFNQALAMGFEYIAKYIPGAGQAMMMYQLIQFSEWLGEVANIAAYAQTDDEVDIAAQAIAHKLAGFLVFEAISRTRRGAVGLGGKLTGLKGKGVAPKASGGDAEGKGAADESATGGKDKPPAGKSDVAHGANETTPKADETKTPVQEASQQKSQTDAPVEKAPAQEAAQQKPKSKPVADTPVDKPPVQDAKVDKPGDAGADKTATPGGEGKAAEQKPAQNKAPDQKAPAADSAAPPVQQPAAAKKTQAIGDVLTSDRSGFGTADPDVQSRLTPDQKAALNRLDTAYQAYAKRKGDKALTPEKWLKAQTDGKPREDAESLFGEDYRRGGTPATPGARPTVALADIPQPAGYSADRAAADLKTIEANASLWDRLSALRKRGIENGRIDPGLLNILKGNIGEILARPEMDSRLAQVHEKFPDAKLEFGTRIARKRPDGSFEAPKLFGDGIIVSEKNGQLQMHDVFEVKSGGKGGAEATSQFFEWREGTLADGDQIVLADGRRFSYAPGSKGPGTVRGMQTATPHIVATRGAEHLGGGSGDQVAVDAVRSALPQTADELEFLARKVLEKLPAATTSSNPGTSQ